jgi:hypothetical protein
MMICSVHLRTSGAYTTALATAASRCIVQDFASLTPRCRLQRAREAYEHELTTAWRRGAGKEGAGPDATKASGNDAMAVDDIEIVYRLYLEETAKV